MITVSRNSRRGLRVINRGSDDSSTHRCYNMNAAARMPVVSIENHVIVIHTARIIAVSVSPSRRRCDIIISVNRRTLQMHVKRIVDHRFRLFRHNVIHIHRSVQTKRNRLELFVSRKRIPLIFKLINRQNRIYRIIIKQTEIHFQLDSLYLSRLDLNAFFDVIMINIRFHQNDEVTFICFRTNIFHVIVKLGVVFIVGGI